MASKIDLLIAEHADDVRYDTKERGGYYMGRVMVDISKGVSRCLFHTKGAYAHSTKKLAIADAKRAVERAVSSVKDVPLPVEEEKEPGTEPEPLSVGDTITIADEESGAEISGEVTKIGTKYATVQDGDGEMHKIPLEDLQS